MSRRVQIVQSAECILSLACHGCIRNIEVQRGALLELLQVLEVLEVLQVRQRDVAGSTDSVGACDSHGIAY